MMRNLLPRRSAGNFSTISTGKACLLPSARHRKKNILAIGIFAAISILVVSVIFYVADTQSAQPLPLQHHTVLLLDRTDPLPVEVEAFVTSRLQTLKRTLPTGAMLTVVEINATSGGNVKPLLQVRKPRSTGSMTTENVDEIARNYIQEWENQIDILAKKLKHNVPEAIKTSPIIETTRRLEDLPEYSSSVPRRELIIISDMLQNSRAINVYEKTLFFSDLEQTVWPDFSRMHVSVYQVTRTTQFHRSRQTTQLRQFWEDFFFRCGATIAWHFV